MKKILSVALSTAMAFSMFASVAFGDTAVSPQQQFDALKAKGVFTGYPDGTAGLDKEMTRAEFAKVITKLLGLKEITGVYSYNDKNYNAKNWAAPYIEAVTAAGIMEGKNVEKKIFDFNGKVTIEEMAKVLTIALDLEVPTETNNTATAWAKGYVQAAINAGLLDSSLNFQSNASRQLLVGAAYSIDQAQSLKVSSYEVTEEGKVVTFKISDGESVKVTLDKALEANKETEVKFTYKDKEFTEKVTYVVTTATKLQTVSADNLREVKVVFDGEVDEATATDESNYTIDTDDGDAVNVKSAALSSDKKTVTLTVANTTNDDKGFTNQKEYTIDVANVRAGSNVITASDVAFTPVDAALPVANTVEALGNKAVKITFSEPVTSAVNSNNFKINGSAVVGTTDVSGNTVILKLYSTLSTGEQTINVNGVADFSGLQSVSKDFKFNVVEDKTAPTVASVVSASFETVTLKFSEPVDPSTLSAGNVYWNQGSTKRTADSFEAVSDDTYKFTFTGDNKLIYSTSLYVSGVQDYSGNTIASGSSITVNPVVDQTRPEVVSAKLADNSSSELVVKFTKALDSTTATDADNYVIKNSDGDVVSEFKSITLSDNNKTATITLFEALTEGKTYTLSINNVSDSTTLKNVLLPYSTTIKVGDVTAPELSGAYYTISNNRLIVNFDKAMATSGNNSALDKTKYVYATTDGVWKALPSGANLTISSDGKSVIVVFPSSVKVDTIAKIRVTNVQSAGGVTLAGLVQEKTVNPEAALALNGDAKATATNKIKVYFNQNIQTASTSDFEVTNGSTKLSVVSVSVSDDVATLTLSDSYKLSANGTYASAPVTVNVLANRNLVTPAGAKFVTAASKPVVDGIAPSISSVTQKATLNETANTVTTSVYFTEAIATLGANEVYDFDVTVDGTVLKPGSDFTIAKDNTNPNVINITINNGTVNPSANLNKIVKVRVNPTAKFLKDASTEANVAAGTTSYYSAIIQK
ncbi:Ig-like domain-containing protein [Paenibacillus taichungensis]|uniref:Ig-like domain-containing protein n=1 Tax=Paenibacillus taichungensis TaxID=484184 RepID=UPI003D9A22FB